MTPTKQIVILAHGIGCLPLTMTWLQRRLAERGFDTLNWGYPSFFRPIDAHAKQLCAQLDRLEADESVERIHLVGHSMGSIVCRAALVKRIGLLHKLGRFVMLTPPNRGSFWGRWLGSTLGRLSTPVAELSDEPTSYVNQLAWPEGIETAVFTTQIDFLVSHDCTEYPGAKVVRQYPGLHSHIVLRKDVADATAQFLLHGTLDEVAAA